MRNRKEYQKAWNESHKEYRKAWYEAHKEQHKEHVKAWYQAHKEQHKALCKAYKESHKEVFREYQKEWHKAYYQADLNTLGQTKGSIRNKSNHILKEMNLHIDGYQIHHCFGYEDANKFIYISKSLHLKIHKFLRENNIPADSNHWMSIRELVNSSDEFTYIKY